MGSFYEWKSMVITIEVMAEFKRRQDALKEALATRAGIDPLTDREFVGAIKAYQDMLDIDLEEVGES